MSEATHTPGPWRIENRYFVESTTGPKHIRGISTVADCRPYASDDHPEAEANARLIAAAPDLLVELQESLPLLHLLAAKMNTPAVVVARIESAKAAIRKATQGA